LVQESLVALVSCRLRLGDAPANRLDFAFVVLPPLMQPWNRSEVITPLGCAMQQAFRCNATFCEPAAGSSTFSRPTNSSPFALMKSRLPPSLVAVCSKMLSGGRPEMFVREERDDQ
jgi:hypothetical protein